MTVFLMLAVVVATAYINSNEIETSFGKSQQDANAELAKSKSSEVDGLILGYLEKARTVTNLMLQDFADEEQRQRALDLVFFRDLDLVNLEIYQMTDGRPTLYKRVTNETYLKKFGQGKSYIDRVRREKPFPVISVFSDAERVPVRNSALPSGAPLFSVGVAFTDASGVVRQVTVADVRLDRLQKAFVFNGARSLYLVDSEGSILAHSDDRQVYGGRSFAAVPIVKQALSQAEASNNGQRRFRDPGTGEWFAGAYSRTSFGLTVIAQTPESIILEFVQLVQRRTYEVAAYAVSGALFFVMIFSITLTLPIEKLHEATLLVAKGNFDIRARIRSSDEVGELAKAFNHMVVGLKERDKVKMMFSKFHGSSVTEDLLKGDLALGGSRKEVTVLFSDIRDFTKFSEGHTPEEVVEMLNEYFQIMVGIIVANHGIVDKFVGDAIMAIWGAPNSTGQDCYHALKAALEMRAALANLNDRRLTRGQTAIRFGIGLHAGPAISGTIGSMERMEYTVIGDTVNMASRIEASTKAFGADLLASETVVRDLEARFIIEYAGAAEVKGKSEPIKMFKIRGHINPAGQHVLVRTPYSDYAPEEADKVKIAG